ncbi:hypothetical protein BDQ12DRAFT_674918 [Crucibulum laeve]|uniref:Protein EFR3 n=1 Tax=Crucibulum laeve TaxID=68775 RepID=A0A5C3MQB3_9AGAR|nr:hypothetical protein BDQ12DRAFT_674918 [Crucibulum laeve]
MRFHEILASEHCRSSLSARGHTCKPTAAISISSFLICSPLGLYNARFPEYCDTMHLLFTPNHLQLLNSCYPPSSTLLTAGPEYSPNSHELSRLTYYASNHPGKLTKLGNELEKRLRAECRKARNGNIRSRASLLISLSILRSLATECRRDIVLLSPSLIASVSVTLSSFFSDLEILARAATVFTAWTTYTDGHLIGADSSMTNDYLLALERFSTLSCTDNADKEVQNRTRLIGFAALTGALNSEALYNDSTQFRAQVSTILRPILMVLFEIKIAILDEQSMAIKDSPASPYLAEFRTRPAMERRAASIHVHIDGDKGPSSGDVLDAALRAFFSLMSHANGVQLGHIMQSSFDNLDSFEGWRDLDHCCWFAQKTAEWAQYQYRYVIPTWLVELLIKNQESPIVSPLHIALTAMVTAVFNSPTTLVNLSSSDILSNLMGLLLRRIAVSADDPLLLAVIECISSLGRHVYYSDQILDLAGELINRLIVIEVQGVLAHGKPEFAPSRSAALRALLRGLVGLIRAANKEEIVQRDDNIHNQTSALPRSPSPSAEIIKKDTGADERPTRRTRVPPDIWQDTLSLLCDYEYSVRAEYADALVFYIIHEMPKQGDAADSDGVKRVRKLAEGPFLHAAHMNVLLNAGDLGNKFLSAAHAYVYILSTARTLGLPASLSRSQSPQVDPSPQSPPIISVEEHDDSIAPGLDSLGQSHANGRRSFSVPHTPRIRKVSLVQKLVERTSSTISDATSASLSDYSNILKVLSTIHEQVPVRGLLAGVPVLVRMHAATNNLESRTSVHRVHVIREVVSRVWLVIGKVWNSPELVALAEQALSSSEQLVLPEPILSSLSDSFIGRNPTQFSSSNSAECEIGAWSGIDIEKATMIISSSETVQEATGLDAEGLYRRFTMHWTPEIALRDSDRSANFDTTFRGDGISPLLKISPALMHIENMSLQSLTRSSRGLGVTDLREALEGRSSLSNPALARPPSISTLDHTSIIGGDLTLRLTQTRSRSRTKRRAPPSASGEVRDVLTKLGIGKQSANLLKASFPVLQKSDQRRTPSKT